MSLLNDLQDRISYRFRDPQLLLQALTHRSSLCQNNELQEDNERLEFLGDSVIELAISHLLVARFPNLDEGGLSKARASLVREATLSSLAREIGLGEALLLGRGEKETGGRGKDSILAGGMEALAAAVYLDGGYTGAFRVIEQIYTPHLEELERGLTDEDFKTQLQEYTQKHLNAAPFYTVAGEEGPDHDKTFEVIISIGGTVYGRGKGKSKKEAEQRAAAEALKLLR